MPILSQKRCPYYLKSNAHMISAMLIISQKQCSHYLKAMLKWYQQNLIISQKHAHTFSKAILTWYQQCSLYFKSNAHTISCSYFLKSKAYTVLYYLKKNANTWGKNQHNFASYLSLLIFFNLYLLEQRWNQNLNNMHIVHFGQIFAEIILD